RSSKEPREVREPDLDERPDALLEPVLLRQPQCRLVALARLLRRHTLLQPIVARDEMLLNLLAGRVGHGRSVALPLSGKISQMEPAEAPRPEPVRVLIADDDPMFVESIETLLRGDARVH